MSNGHARPSRRLINASLEQVLVGRLKINIEWRDQIQQASDHHWLYMHEMMRRWCSRAEDIPLYAYVLETERGSSCCFVAERK